MSQYNFFLDNLARSTPGVVHGLLVSDDGLRQAKTAQLQEGLADSLSAMTCGLISLANGGGRLLGDLAVHQVAITYEGGHLLLMSTGLNSHLAVLAAADSDLGAVAFAMAELVRRLADNALVPARSTETRGAY